MAVHVAMIGGYSGRSTNDGELKGLLATVITAPDGHSDKFTIFASASHKQKVEN
ncbi:uncharacterized protein G2W53_023571 [Senna tora]|uniref:Uncharacterized protein n=1 Tax=Senna tora TaxID=362788 RepID=A0A834TBQ3_9FABA|nr:uncharacterized protein G2W53_023571 [Senna tora]